MPRAAPVHWRAAPVREAQGRAAVGRGSAMHVCTGAAPGLAVLSTCAVCVGARACARVRTRRGTGSVKTPFTSARWASSRKPWSSRCAPHTRCAPAGDAGATRGRAWRAPCTLFTRLAARPQVLCDCDCAVILKSGPTVTCKEGRFMAYCSKDLECLMRGEPARPQLQSERHSLRAWRGGDGCSPRQPQQEGRGSSGARLLIRSPLPAPPPPAPTNPACPSASSCPLAVCAARTQSASRRCPSTSTATRCFLVSPVGA